MEDATSQRAARRLPGRRAGRLGGRPGRRRPVRRLGGRRDQGRAAGRRSAARHLRCARRPSAGRRPSVRGRQPGQALGRDRPRRATPGSDAARHAAGRAPTCSSPTSGPQPSTGSGSATTTCSPATPASCTPRSPGTGSRAPTPTGRATTSAPSTPARASPTPRTRRRVPAGLAQRLRRSLHRASRSSPGSPPSCSSGAHRATAGSSPRACCAPGCTGWRGTSACNSGSVGASAPDHGDENGVPLVHCYRAGDGRGFWLLCLEGDRHWPKLLAALDRRDLADDERFATAPSPATERGGADRHARRRRSPASSSTR